MSEIIPLRDLRIGDAAQVGRKAATLGEMTAAGLPVPDGFCVPISAYRQAMARLRPAGLAADLAADLAARELRAAIEAAPLAESLRAGLARAYRTVAAGRRVAVRSSAVAEDSAGASFAGQYRTELALGSLDQVEAAVKRCWASLWQPHAIGYRTRHGIPHADAAMACIVQVMVEADAAGVLFTADPSIGPDLLIESSWGYGEAVVSGLVTPDRFAMSRASLRVVSAGVARKPHMIGTALGRTAVLDVPQDRQATASLTDDQATELARLGLTIERWLGSPQDVEWAIAGGQISILQARPITGPAGWVSPVPGARWARISICDSWLPEPLSPLFASTMFPELIKGWLEGWAGQKSARADNPLLPRPMEHTINGFAYLRVDYELNKYPLRAARLIVNFFRFYLGRLERRWREMLPRHVERIEALAGLDLTRLRSEDVLGLIGEAQRLSGRYWGLVGGLAWYWNAGEWCLARLYPHVTRRIAPDGALPAYGTLLQGNPTKTAEAEAALFDIARSPGLTAQFADFLARYGHQVYNLDFVEPTPAENPASFQAAVSAYRDGRVPDPRDRLRALAVRRDTLLERIMTGLRWSPARRGLLRVLLRWNRHYGELRDRVLFYFTLGWPVIRRAYLELGRRLAAAGALSQAEDVFYLTGDELTADLAALAGGDTPPSRVTLTRGRRALREQRKLLNPPDQVPARSRVLLGNVDITALAMLRRRAADEGTLHGSAVSPGRVTGTARRICAVDDFCLLRPGEVLVAPYITPAWSPLLAIAAGVVTDAGGALSHGSIVAREYGIPAVMGTGNATKVITDGQMITIDGDRGLVGFVY